MTLLLSATLAAPVLTHCAANNQLSSGGEEKAGRHHVYPLDEINFSNLEKENEGLKVVPENATAVRDYYRGGVQEKSLAEKEYREGKFKEAKYHFEKSDRYLIPVLRFLPMDEAHRNIYGNQHIIFVPNLLIADNHLKLARTIRKMKGPRDEVHENVIRAKEFISLSTRSMKSEWAAQIERELEGLDDSE